MIYTDIVEFDIVSAQKNVAIFLSKTFAVVLRESDHVHFSEFLTQTQKDAMLASRLTKREEFNTFNTLITNSTTKVELKKLTADIINWSRR